MQSNGYNLPPQGLAAPPYTDYSPYAPGQPLAVVPLTSVASIDDWRSMQSKAPQASSSAEQQQQPAKNSAENSGNNSQIVVDVFRRASLGVQFSPGLHPQVGGLNGRSPSPFGAPPSPSQILRDPPNLLEQGKSSSLRAGTSILHRGSSLRAQGKLSSFKPSPREERRLSALRLSPKQAGLGSHGPGQFASHGSRASGKGFDEYDRSDAMSIPGTSHPALEVETLLDASLLLGMERTLYSSFNVAWIIIFLGFGLMMVGAQNEDLSDKLGVATVITGMVFVFGSWCHHWSRIYKLGRGKGLTHMGSLTWTFFLMFIFIAAVSIELNFALHYPYLKRSKVVELAGITPPPSGEGR